MFTRSQYVISRECSHDEYYRQFVTAEVRAMVESRIGLDAILASKDDLFSNVPLRVWDLVGLPLGVAELLREHGDIPTECGIVCINKQAAKLIKEEVERGRS